MLLLVCARSPELARGVWAWAVAHPDTMLASVCSVALSELRRAGAPVHAEAEAALASERPQLRRAIAGYLASGAWFQQPEGFEEPLLTQFVSDKDGNVARQAAVAALRLRGTDPKAAARISLAASSRAGDQDMLFATLSRSGIEKLSSEHAKLLEERLLAAPDLSWGGCRALADVGAANPSAVVRIVAARVRRGESEQGYRPVPFHDHHLDLLARAPADRRRTLLNAFLNEVVGLDRRSWRSIAAAFWWIVGPGMDRIESAESLASQEEAIGAACAALLDALELDDALAAAVLRATPWLVVVSKPEWISALMASSPSGEVVSEVERALHAAVVTGGGSRAIGAPSPRLVQTAELAERAVRQLPPGRTRRFYEVVASRARADIEQDRLDDEELESGWG